MLAYARGTQQQLAGMLLLFLFLQWLWVGSPPDSGNIVGTCSYIVRAHFQHARLMLCWSAGHIELLLPTPPVPAGSAEQAAYKLQISTFFLCG
jgi:hypothetical protein